MKKYLLENKSFHQISSEVEIHQQLDHDNIIKFFDSFMTTDKKYYCIVVEYAGRGNIKKLLKSLK